MSTYLGAPIHGSYCPLQMHIWLKDELLGDFVSFLFFTGSILLI